MSEQPIEECFMTFEEWWENHSGWGGEMLAEGQLAQSAWNASTSEAKERIADLERQLAEKQAEIDRFKATPDGGWFGMWCVADRDRMALRAENAAMSPMIEACKSRHDHHLAFNEEGDAFTCHCLTCQWYRDYEARRPK